MVVRGHLGLGLSSSITWPALRLVKKRHVRLHIVMHSIAGWSCWLGLRRVTHTLTCTVATSITNRRSNQSRSSPSQTMDWRAQFSTGSQTGFTKVRDPSSTLNVSILYAYVFPKVQEAWASLFQCTVHIWYLMPMYNCTYCYDCSVQIQQAFVAIIFKGQRTNASKKRIRKGC